MENFLEPAEFNIDNLFKGKYNIPIYQRPYSWENEQVKQLLADIEKSYILYKEFTNSQSSIKNEEMLLFVGTLFLKSGQNVKNTYTEYDIVDGQQRITTITLIFMAILNHLYCINSDDEAVREIENYLWKKVDRKREKDSRVLTLGNIDKAMMINLFDALYAHKDIIAYANSLLETNIDNVERNMILNLLVINDYLCSFEDNEEYYHYFEFLKYNIRFIAIAVHTNLVKLFDIFESINSKGKPLEDIDLIKSYIFQNINEDDYDEYLNKWGRLISETKDNLMDYFTIYIRANVSFYRNSIKVKHFKNLVENGLANYYGTDNIRDTLTCFIDDMIDNLPYYQMLTDISMLEKINISKKTIVFFMMNNMAEYLYDKALFFKLLILHEKNHLSNETIDRIVEYTFKFILTFQSICARESKATLTVFVDVQNEIYKLTDNYEDRKDISSCTLDSVIVIFNKYITGAAINNASLRNGIKGTLSFTKNKKVVRVLLSYLEYLDNSTPVPMVDYTKLYWLLQAKGDIHVDHILPQKPDKDDENFKYYVSDDTVFLKEGQDFINADSPGDMIIGKEEFYDQFIHVLGNLRLEWANDNIKKSNHFVVLKEYDKSFNSSSQISTRSTMLINQLLSSGILLSMDNLEKINFGKDFTPFTISEFESGFEYKSYEPVSFELIGEKYNLDSYNYTQLLIKVFTVLYDLENKQFEEFASSSYKPMRSERIYISHNKDDVRNSFLLGKDVFVENNLSSDYIIKFIYIVVKDLGLNNSDLKINLVKI